eukprot:CAMPEP_0183702792 /NCGR_PEP_ID=MMETSP0737-20130205/786_1 /TAXON_ID=385413 /ORGANISM="Thalassiosira miniscula, Strain CCMP1093" /LENGTH=392 /DNA_ID=CAMNT_0025929467 /DNA_START=203 /DNA_END=1378 /DNA_ORIENTATION=+
MILTAYISGVLTCALYYRFGELETNQQEPLLQKSLLSFVTQPNPHNDDSLNDENTRIQSQQYPSDNSNTPPIQISSGEKMQSSLVQENDATAPFTIKAGETLSCQTSIKECCETSIRNPPEKIDIVIPYKYRNAADVSLMYELRSFERSGLLDHVGKVFIITNSKSETNLLEIRYQKYLKEMMGTKQLHIIAADEIKVPFNFPEWRDGGKNFDPLGIGLVKTHYAPYLPLLSSYYLMIPDDNVLLREYTRDIWFDSKKQLPYAHGFGGGGTGMKTHGFAGVAEMHGPNFLNRCSMQYVIEKYNVTHPKGLSPTAVAIGMMKREKLLSGFFGYRSSSFRKVEPYKTEFFRECHTNGGCQSPNGFTEIFVNIQGNGISIEYRKAESIKGKFLAW